MGMSCGNDGEADAGGLRRVLLKVNGLGDEVPRPCATRSEAAGPILVLRVGSSRCIRGSPTRIIEDSVGQNAGEGLKGNWQSVLIELGKTQIERNRYSRWGQHPGDLDRIVIRAY